jgi:sarcosine oxidase subunit gamma
VTVEAPAPVGPLASWAQTLTGLPAGIRIRELPFPALVDLRVRTDDAGGDAVAKVLGAALPTRACTTTRVEDLHVLWLGPDEWLVVGPPGAAGQLEADLCAALDGSGGVCDVSAQWTTLSLTGPRVADVLAHGCAVDLHPGVAPVGTCVQTRLAQANVVVVVHDHHDGAVSDVWVLVQSSVAGYLAAWLVDACSQYTEDQHTEDQHTEDQHTEDRPDEDRR